MINSIAISWFYIFSICISCFIYFIFIFGICRVYVLRTSIDNRKDNGFKLAKERSRKYPTQTITDADYQDDIALPANTPAQAETLLHCLEWAAAVIHLNVNADKTEYEWFNQRGAISTLIGNPLKLVDNFTYLVSSVSSTETDINAWLAKVWTSNDSLSLICTSDLTEKIKATYSRGSLYLDE